MPPTRSEDKIDGISDKKNIFGGAKPREINLDKEKDYGKIPPPVSLKNGINDLISPISSDASSHSYTYSKTPQPQPTSEKPNVWNPTTPQIKKNIKKPETSISPQPQQYNQPHHDNSNPQENHLHNPQQSEYRKRTFSMRGRKKNNYNKNLHGFNDSDRTVEYNPSGNKK